MKIIGITGPSGAGKTCVLEYLRTKGLRVICADEVYHRLLDNCAPMRERIKERFHTLDTKALGRLAFENEKVLRELEDITHPYVIDEIRPMLKNKDGGNTIIEAIALRESGLDGLCDAVIYVTADYDRLVDRITTRDGITREYAEARIKSRRFNTDNTYVLENNGDLLSLYARTDVIYADISGEDAGGNYIKTI